MRVHRHHDVQPPIDIAIIDRLVDEAAADLMQEAGFPPGVFNVVQGDKEAVDALLAELTHLWEQRNR